MRKSHKSRDRHARRVAARTGQNPFGLDPYHVRVIKDALSAGTHYLTTVKASRKFQLVLAHEGDHLIVDHLGKLATLKELNPLARSVFGREIQKYRGIAA